MSGSRAVVRLMVAIALCFALACSAFSMPEDLPTVALGQAALYRLEIALAVFYGSLLLLTPAYSGLASGRLPIEISTRGAKFAEESDLTAEKYETSIEALEQTSDRLSEGLEKVTVAIRRLEGDKT